MPLIEPESEHLRLSRLQKLSLIVKGPHYHERFLPSLLHVLYLVLMRFIRRQALAIVRVELKVLAMLLHLASLGITVGFLIAELLVRDLLIAL